MNNNRRIFLKLSGVAGLSLAGNGVLESLAGEILIGSPLNKDIKYEETTDLFPNPERGFYQELSAKSEGSGLNPTSLAGIRAENRTLVLRIYYLEKFKDNALSEAQFSLMNVDMQKLRDAGIKCILRFAYTSSMEVGDAPLTIVEQHLDQLKPFFNEHKDVISFIQAGFIGAWGEWHASSNGLATTENQRKVLFKLLSVLPPEIMVQVRTPGQKQRIFETKTPVASTKAFTIDHSARVGHHNDCFMTNDTDYGTYSKDNVQAEKQYISDEGLFVPTGGETCPPVPKENVPTCEIATSTMRFLRWTYLHLSYYRPTINAWKEAGCFDILQRDLGYRLLLESASLPEQVRLKKDITINLKLINKGYAPLYHYKISSLILVENTLGKTHELVLPIDLRKCQPSKGMIISEKLSMASIPKGTYNLFLKISDRDEKLKSRSEYSIRLANKGVWDAARGINNLKHRLSVV